MAAASEKVRLITTDVETLRLHYAYTLRALAGADATRREAKIVALYDERFFRMWEFYLAGGIVAFENGAMCNYQVQYVRDRRALPITRDYMAEAEAHDVPAPSRTDETRARRSPPGPLLHRCRYRSARGLARRAARCISIIWRASAGALPA